MRSFGDSIFSEADKKQINLLGTCSKISSKSRPR